MHALKEKYYQQFSKDLAQIVKYLSDLTSRRVSDRHCSVRNVIFLALVYEVGWQSLCLGVWSSRWNVRSVY